MTRLWARRPSATGRTGQRGQSLVELCFAIPVVMVLLLGMLEFGFAFSHHLTLEYATREGARLGAALADGKKADGTVSEVACTGTSNVDAYIIAAVQRVLKGSGSQVVIGQVSEIRIYKADTNGLDTLSSNKWVPGVGPTVDGLALEFARSGATNWDPCGRDNAGSTVDSIGVSLIYNYKYITPLGNLMGLGGSPQLKISDRTIMALNPPSPS